MNQKIINERGVMSGNKRNEMNELKKFKKQNSLIEKHLQF